jgi:hypothetical protein
VPYLAGLLTKVAVRQAERARRRTGRPLSTQDDAALIDAACAALREAGPRAAYAVLAAGLGSKR